ncbi:MAG: MBL fold metallo-hydrolase [Legionellales bacterium]|nr:MBL fold metallo-hydrolase [Legionellales bacterium]
MYQLTSLMGNSQQLDGGAMFGNVPKALWKNWVSVDDTNRIQLACRALLVHDTERDINILLETGIGMFFDPALKARYGVIEDQHVLLSQLAELGLSDKDIDFVILSHLHFDHAGGLLSAWQADKQPELLFPNAQFIVSEIAWERALHPHARDKTSFIPKLNELLQQSNRLVAVKEESTPLLGKNIHFHYSNGHTPGMLITEIAMPLGSVFFVADLIPGTPWVHLPVTMGYDRFPETLIDEKRTILENIVQHHGRIFYTHDPDVALSRVIVDEKGRFVASEACPSIRMLTQ